MFTSSFPLSFDWDSRVMWATLGSVRLIRLMRHMVKLSSFFSAACFWPCQMLEITSKSKLSKCQRFHFQKKFSIDRAPQSVASVIKYSFARFRRILSKLSSKLFICIVLTEKDALDELRFRLNRSATHILLKIFIWDDCCAHALRGIRYLVFLWNAMWSKSEIW
jgi:hypothetical protein